jgi:peptidoglycan hydrolase CwlO-like protein
MGHIWANLNALTQSAIIIITVIAVWFHVRWTRRNTALGPTFLTTLGIFFCFTGIAWGLLNFDANDVRYSIPHLLEGIRTSFWASVAGIFWALTIKARLAVWGDAKLSLTGNQPGATLSDVAGALGKLNSAIAGSEDSTLLGQLKLLRSDSNYRLEKLHQALESHAVQVAEVNARLLVQALNEVMRDFNSKVNDQFGDNFKELNAAVARLVSWQSGYEHQMRSLIEQETATRQSMTEAASRFTEMVRRSSEFTEIAGSLKKLLVGLNTEKEQLNFSLSTLGELINSAANNLPSIEQNINAMTRQIEQGVRTNQDALAAVLKSAAQSMQSYNQQLSAASQRFAQDGRR